MIDGLIAGRLMGDVSRRTDKVGRGYTVARVLARNKADEEFIVNVIAFDDAVCAALLALADGDALSLTGSLTPKVWTDKQGIVRPSLDLVATQVMTAFDVSRKQAPLPLCNSSKVRARVPCTPVADALPDVGQRLAVDFAQRKRTGFA